MKRFIKIGGAMKEKIVGKINVNGKLVRIRYPTLKDVKGLLDYINSLIEERAFIGKQRKVSEKEESKYVRNLIHKIENKKSVALVAEQDGKILGFGDVHKNPLDALRYVGSFGIGIRKEARGMGIGEKLAGLLIKEAKKKLKIKIIELHVFANNTPAINLYKKLGFEEVGRIRKGNYYYGKFIDDIIMVKYL
jgi:ribosomal protein S18 acetylase RimI-like enzyme